MSENLGMKIRSLRLKLGMTLDEFGELIGNANRSNVYKWEKGMSKPNAQRIQKIAEIAGVSVEEFMNNQISIKSIQEANYLYRDLQFIELNISNIKDALDAISNLEESDLDKICNVVEEKLTYREYKKLLEKELSLEQQKYKEMLENTVKLQNDFLNSNIFNSVFTNDIISLDSLLSSDFPISLNEKKLTAEDKKRALEVLKLFFL